MTFLPIVERELRVTARRPVTYWMRTAVVLCVVLVSAWVFMMQSGQRSSEIGQTLFYVLTAGAGFYCLFAGVRSTADCLSEEKREGTLGLLFLTNLRGYDIVLGKLAANSLGTIYGVLSIVPALGIPILLGGTSAGQFVRVSVTLLVTLFFSLAAGMFASAVCRSSRKAMTLTFVIILLFTAGMPALGAWLAYQARGSVPLPFLATSPVFVYVAGLDWNVVRLQDGYYWGLGTLMGLGVALLGGAALIVPQSWQDRPLANRPRENGASSPATIERHAFRTRLLNMNPFFWLATRPRSRAFHVWWGFAFVGAVWLWGLAKLGDEWFNIGSYLATAFFLNSMLKVWLASEACRQIAFERKHGTLELLLATPLSVPQIVAGQRLALERQFGLPILTTLVLECIMLGASLRDSAHIGGERAMWFWMWLLAMALLVLDVGALFWTGLWEGLTARDGRRAYTRVVGIILVLPWVLFAGFAGLLAAAPPAALSGGSILGVWFFCSLAVDLGFGLSARQRLMTEFRQRATERFKSSGGAPN